MLSPNQLSNRFPAAQTILLTSCQLTGIEFGAGRVNFSRLQATVLLLSTAHNKDSYKNGDDAEAAKLCLRAGKVFDRMSKGIREAPGKALIGDLAAESGDRTEGAFGELLFLKKIAANRLGDASIELGNIYSELALPLDIWLMWIDSLNLKTWKSFTGEAFDLSFSLGAFHLKLHIFSAVKKP